jgi:hypothetical protein
MTILLRLSIRLVIRRLVATDDDLPDLGKATSEMAHISSKFDNPVSEFIGAWLASSRHGGSLAVSKVNGCPPTSVHQTGGNPTLPRHRTLPQHVEGRLWLRVGSGPGSALAQGRVRDGAPGRSRQGSLLEASAGSVC